MSLQPERLSQPLQERARAVRSEAEALHLLGGGWEDLRDHHGELVFQSLLSGVGLLSQRVIDWVMGESPRSAHFLLDNPALEPELREHLVERGLEEFRQGFFEESDTLALPFAELVCQACRRGDIPFGSERERWLREVALAEGRERLEERPETLLHRRMQAAVAVAHCPEVPTEVLSQLLAVFEGEIGTGRAYPALLLPFLESPQADLALWRRLAEWGEFYPSLLVALSRRTEARVDEPIRFRLVQDSERESIAVALCLDDREDSRARLRGLVRHRPRLAVEVLEHPECSVICRLEREDWVEMLASPHAPLRLRSLQMQARQREVLEIQEDTLTAPVKRGGAR